MTSGRGSHSAVRGADLGILRRHYLYSTRQRVCHKAVKSLWPGRNKMAGKQTPLKTGARNTVCCYLSSHNSIEIGAKMVNGPIISHLATISP